MVCARMQRLSQYCESFRVAAATDSCPADISSGPLLLAHVSNLCPPCHPFLCRGQWVLAAEYHVVRYTCSGNCIDEKALNRSLADVVTCLLDLAAARCARAERLEDVRIKTM